MVNILFLFSFLSQFNRNFMFSYMYLSGRIPDLFIQIVVILMISSSAAISKVKPCELQTALDSIQLPNYHHPCIYATIKEKSERLLGFGISYLVIHLIALVLAMVRTQLFTEKYTRCILWIFVSIF